MRAVFARQAATALRLRGSSAAERIAKIRRLRDAVIAHTDDFYRAAAAAVVAATATAATVKRAS